MSHLIPALETSLAEQVARRQTEAWCLPRDLDSRPLRCLQFVLNTDETVNDMREHLAYIYSAMYVDFVAKNPVYVPGQPFRSARCHCEWQLPQVAASHGLLLSHLFHLACQAQSTKRLPLSAAASLGVHCFLFDPCLLEVPS